MKRPVHRSGGVRRLGDGKRSALRESGERRDHLECSDKAFCVGADLKERRGFEQMISPPAAVCSGSLRGTGCGACTVIAAGMGFAMAGGCELALCCDLDHRVGDAVFGLPEVGLGLIPRRGAARSCCRDALG